MSDSYVKLEASMLPYYRQIIDYKIFILGKDEVEAYKREQREYYQLPFYKRMFDFKPCYVQRVRNNIHYWRCVLDDLNINKDVYVELWFYKKLKELEKEYEGATNSKDRKSI